MEGGIASLPNDYNASIEQCLDMYEKLLGWYFDNNDKTRQIILFKELRKIFHESQSMKTDNEFDLNGLCLGQLTAQGIHYQYEYPYTEPESNEDFSSLTDMKYSQSNEAIPVCAAINEVHLFHFGNIFKDLAYMFYSLPNSLCRAHYMVPLLELYSDVLRQTFEMLELDWKTIFQGFNRVKLLQQFYNYIPRAIIDAIIVQMRYTNIKELEDICTHIAKPVMWKDTEKSNDGSNEASTIPSKFIPLSIERIQYLISLLDLTYKSI